MWFAHVCTVSRPLRHRTVHADLELLRCAASHFARPVIATLDTRNPERLITEYTALLRGGGQPYECEGYLTWFLVRPMADYDTHPGLWGKGDADGRH